MIVAARSSDPSAISIATASTLRLRISSVIANTRNAEGRPACAAGST
jgi:hypothetical protein